MNVEKAQIKIGTAHEIGVHLDDMLEAAEAQVYRQEGAAMALKQAIGPIVGLAEHVKKDLTEGKLDEFGELGLKVSEYVIRYINRAAGAVENLATAAEVGKLKALGKVDGLRDAVKSTKKVMDGERQKVSAFVEASKDGSMTDEGAFAGAPEDRPTGVHPGDPLAGRRNGAAAAADIQSRRRQKGKPARGSDS